MQRASHYQRTASIISILENNCLNNNEIRSGLYINVIRDEFKTSFSNAVTVDEIMANKRFKIKRLLNHI